MQGFNTVTRQRKIEQIKMNNIEAKIVASSYAPSGACITTFELTYPRFIHSEFMTHRLFSRNAASSRAIPFEKVCEQVENNPAHPEEWGINRPGMQASENLKGHMKDTAMWAWKQAAKSAVKQAKTLNEMGLHKQIVNRVLEPFAYMRTVLTATEYDNFFWLRNHKDAQPEIRILAERMLDAMSYCAVNELEPGDWHTPYFDKGYWSAGVHKSVVLYDALKISASCCAQVSYRKNDDSLEKARKLCGRLMGDGTGPVHASPFEHQAQPMENWMVDLYQGFDLLDGVGLTHVDRDGELWSGNFKGWVQNRQLIKGHDKRSTDADQV